MCNRNSMIECCCMIMQGCLLNNVNCILLSRITEPIFVKSAPFPVNNVSNGRSIVLFSSIKSTLHYQRIVIVVGILINRLSTVVTNKRPIVHFDGLKLRKTYSSYYTLNNTNQGEGVCSTETLNTKLNGLKRYEIGHFK